jgi:uncharacterized membrane protein YbhN (UPF0104 family)
MRLPAQKIFLSAAVLAGGLAVAATHGALGSRLGSALGILNDADRSWLALSVVGFLAGFLASVSAWRAALAASGARISLPGGAASLGVGALVNSFAPARLGDVVKIALFSRSIDGPDGIWTAGGVYAAVSAARCLSIAALVAAAAATGALPLWPVFALCVAVAIVGGLALSSERWRRYPRIAHLLGGLAALERSPRQAAKVLAWSATTSLARLGAVAALAASLGLSHPLLVAFVVCAALDLAGAVPLTPGNLGVASGAVAVALTSRGIPAAEGLAVGIAIPAVETAFALVVGAAGALYFAGPRWLFSPSLLRPVAFGLAVVAAALLGAVALDLV